MALRIGTPFSETLNGTDSDDTFLGLGGNDVMHGFGGNDTFVGGAGADEFFGDGGSDTVDYSLAVGVPSEFGTFGVIASLATGHGGDFGTNVRDTYHSIENLIGSNFNDLLQGDANANNIQGLAGDDMIEGGAGADVLNGGDGNDFLAYATSAQGVRVDLLNNTSSGGDAQGDVISNFENINGSTHDDVLSGTNGANTLLGQGGDDRIDGRGGDDRIDGWIGNDIMTGGAGRDTFVFEGGANTGIDHIRDFNVRQDHIEIDTNGAHVGTSISIANINFNSMTADVVVHIGQDSQVILDHMSILDISQVANDIQLV